MFEKAGKIANKDPIENQGFGNRVAGTGGSSLDWASANPPNSKSHGTKDSSRAILLKFSHLLFDIVSKLTIL
jgi:hypothetical protein